jgi:tetratricopeptide (TPR) repeat protein
VLNWEKKQFPLAIEFAVDEIVMANAEQELKGPTGFGWQGPSSAATYALQNKINTEKALVWADKALAQTKNFNTLSTKAGLLRQANQTAEAEKMEEAAVAVATEAELNAHGYQLIGENRFDEAIKIMAINTQRNPESANAWDSLGEAYALKGDKANAIAHFKKALSKKPSDAVRINSEKYLKELGGM